MPFPITTGRYFPKTVGTTKFFCPHEGCVRTGEKIQHTIMISFIYIPILPAARIYEWNCVSCGHLIFQNTGKKGIAGQVGCASIIILGGLAMFSVLTYWAVMAGDKSSPINPESVDVARGMLMFFAILGLIIAGWALRNVYWVVREMYTMTEFTPEQLKTIEETLEPGDTFEIMVRKLVLKGFTEPEIISYIKLWAAGQGVVG